MSLFLLLLHLLPLSLQPLLSLQLSLQLCGPQPSLQPLSLQPLNQLRSLQLPGQRLSLQRLNLLPLNLLPLNLQRPNRLPRLLLNLVLLSLVLLSPALLSPVPLSLVLLNPALLNLVLQRSLQPSLPALLPRPPPLFLPVPLRMIHSLLLVRTVLLDPEDLPDLLDPQE